MPKVQVSKSFFNFSTFYTIFTFLAVAIIIAIILTHLYARWKRAKPLNLTSDSIVLIVGACTGIGKLMSIQIAKQYHSTILLVDKRKDLFEEVCKEIKKYNGICQCFMCDLSDPKSVQKVIENIQQQREKIDFLLYNAGIFLPSLSWEAKEEDFDSVMNINFNTPVKMIKAFLPILDGGHIAVVASLTSIIDGGPQLSSYVASKHALFGYLSCLRQQLKKQKRNVTLSIGCPYAINTGMFEGFKTKLDKFLPVLEEKYAAERLIREFINKKEVCFIGRRHALIVKLSKFLPTFFQDWVIINMDQSDFSKKKQ